MVKEDIENRSQNASFHQTYESAQIICDRILWTASQFIADSSASLVRLTRPRESSPLIITRFAPKKKKKVADSRSKKSLDRYKAEKLKEKCASSTSGMYVAGDSSLALESPSC